MNLLGLVKACGHEDDSQDRDVTILKDLEKTKKNALDGTYQLLPHQERGVRWILQQEKHKGHGGILADEMGLGKTLTVLCSIFCWLLGDKNCRGGIANQSLQNLRLRPGKKTVESNATLIVVPDQLVDHWDSQIDKHFTDVFLKNHSKKIKVITENKIEDSLEARVEELRQCDIVIISRDMLSNFKPEERKNRAPSDTLEALLRIEWLRTWYEEGHEMDKRSFRYNFYLHLNARFSWILTGTPVDQMRGDARNIELLLAQIKVLKLLPPQSLADNDPRKVLAECNYNSDLKGVLDQDNAKTILREIMRCTRKDQVVRIGFHREDRRVPHPASEQYRAHEQNTIRNIALERQYKKEMSKFIDTGILQGDKKAEKKCKSLLRFAVGKQIRGLKFGKERGKPEPGDLTFWVPYTDKEIKDKAKPNTDGGFVDATGALECTRTKLMEGLRTPSIQPQAVAGMGTACIECGDVDVKPLITAKCDHVVCSSCFELGTRKLGTVIACCQRGCSVSDSAMYNRSAETSMAEPAGANDKNSADCFDHNGLRLNQTCDLVHEYVRKDWKTVVYVEHRGYMKSLEKALKDRLGAHKVLTAAGGLGQRKKDSRAPCAREFQEERSAKVIIISSDGIMGLDLSSAQALVLAHPVWPGFSLDQLEARIARMGQTAEKVTILTFYAPGTIEESVLKLRDRIKEVGPVELEASESEPGDKRPCLSQRLLGHTLERVNARKAAKRDERRRATTAPQNQLEPAAGSAAAAGRPSLSTGSLRPNVSSAAAPQARGSPRKRAGPDGGGSDGSGGKGKNACLAPPPPSASPSAAASAAPASAEVQPSWAPVQKPKDAAEQEWRELQALLGENDLDIEQQLWDYGIRKVAKFWKLNEFKVSEMQQKNGLTDSDAYDLKEVLKSKPQKVRLEPGV